MKTQDSRLTTPVVLIIFNRPDATARVFERIRQAQPSQLLVVADGPRANHPSDAEKCAAARAIIEGVDWKCEVLANYTEVNMGCKWRVSSGLDWVFETVEEAIILEDDCVPHPTFFRFCEALLEWYRDDERVMMISGTNPLRQWDMSESYLFSRYCFIWGWATWKRAWKKYDIHLSDWEKVKAQKHLHYILPWRRIAEHFSVVFDTVQSGRINTWDYQWFYCCLFNNGLCVVPKDNLISNIGADGTHISSSQVKSDPNLFAPVYALDVENLKHPGLIFGNYLFDTEFTKEKIRISLKNRLKAKVLYEMKKLHQRLTTGQFFRVG